MKKSLLLLAIVCSLLVVDVAQAAPRGGGARAGARPSGAGANGPTLNGARPNLSPTGNLSNVNRADFSGGNVAPGQFNGSRPNAGNVGNFNRPQNYTSGSRPSTDQLNGFLNTRPESSPRANTTRTNAAQQHTTTTTATQHQEWTQGVQNNVRTNVNVAARNAFTPQWYADHPSAWRATHPHADAFAVASWTNAAAWLAIGTEPVIYTYPTDSTTYETSSTDSQYSDPAEQAQAAAQLALAGQNAAATPNGDWLSLGVFALVPGQAKSSNQLVQLQVSKAGLVSGSYLDLLSNSSQPVQGAINKESQRAAWNIGQNSPVVFDTSLQGLTQDSAPLLVRFGDNSQQAWTLVRMPDQK